MCSVSHWGFQLIYRNYKVLAVRYFLSLPEINWQYPQNFQISKGASVFQHTVPQDKCPPKVYPPFKITSNNSYFMLYFTLLYFYFYYFYYLFTFHKIMAWPENITCPPPPSPPSPPIGIVYDVCILSASTPPCMYCYCLSGHLCSLWASQHHSFSCHCCFP